MTLSRRILGRAALGAGCFLLLSSAQLGVGLLSGCDDTTTGNRVVIESLVESDVRAGETFTNDKGWAITLDEATVAFASLTYVEGAPVASLGPLPKAAPAPDRGLLYLLSLRSAHAHPGHYVEGAVVGEMTSPTVVDLLGDQVSLGESEGVTGTARSARIVFADPATSGFADTMGDAVVIVSGVAQKEGEADRRFRGTALPADVFPTGKDIPEVDGCILDDGAVSSDGTVLLTIDVKLWLDQIDFADVPAPTDGEIAELVHGESPHNALSRGIKKALAYHFRFIPRAE